MVSKGSSGYILYLSYYQQIQWKYQEQYSSNYTLVLCVSKAWCVLLLCAMERHCCPKTIYETESLQLVVL